MTAPSEAGIAAPFLVVSACALWAALPRTPPPKAYDLDALLEAARRGERSASFYDQMVARTCYARAAYLFPKSPRPARQLYRALEESQAPSFKQLRLALQLARPDAPAPPAVRAKAFLQLALRSSDAEHAVPFLVEARSALSQLDEPGSAPLRARALAQLDATIESGASAGVPRETIRSLLAELRSR